MEGRRMSLKFYPEEHLYIDSDAPNKNWISVTKLVDMFVEPFDAVKIAEQCSKKKKSKWYGMTPQDIIDAWDRENKRSTDLGSWYHDQREKDVLGCSTINRDGHELSIIDSVYEDDVKIAPEQILSDGIYPEHFVYLESIGLCGQSDWVEVYDGKVNILDYKTNKKIELESFADWKGRHKMMLKPLQHIQDCNYYHYALQLSTYMYMVLRHNPQLNAGSLKIQHVVFEQAGEDKFGYPILTRDEEGNPIVKETQIYELPYLKKEVKLMIDHLEKKGVKK